MPIIEVYKYDNKYYVVTPASTNYHDGLLLPYSETHRYVLEYYSN